jgi:hypothetical protein
MIPIIKAMLYFLAWMFYVDVLKEYQEDRINAQATNHRRIFNERFHTCPVLTLRKQNVTNELAGKL